MSTASISNATATADPAAAPTANLLLRGLAVLRCFGSARSALGSSEIARMTGLPQPTVWRICKTLEAEGYLTLDNDTARYRPGAAVLTLGYAALDSLDMADLAKPPLQDIANRVRGASGLSVRERHAMVLLRRCQAQGASITYNMRTGDSLPMLTSASGWAHLVSLAESDRAALLARLQQADPDTAKATARPMQMAFDAFAKTGYVLNSGILFPGLVSIAVPFTARRRAIHYVISCSATSALFGTRALHEEFGAAMVNIARSLGEA